MLDFHGCPQKYDQLKIMPRRLVVLETVKSVCSFFRGCTAKTVLFFSIRLVRSVRYVFQGQLRSDVVAKETHVLKVDAPRENGRGWKRGAGEISSVDIGEEVLTDVAKGCEYVYRETWVKANDPHFARCRNHGVLVFALARRETLGQL